MKKVEKGMSGLNKIAVAAGFGVAGGLVDKDLLEFKFRVDKPQYKEYLNKDGIPHIKKVTGDNDLSADEVFLMGIINGLAIAAETLHGYFNTEFSKDTKDKLNEIHSDGLKSKDTLDSVISMIHDMKISDEEKKVLIDKALNKAKGK